MIDLIVLPVPEELYLLLSAIAERDGRSVSDVVIEGVRLLVEGQDKPAGEALVPH